MKNNYCNCRFIKYKDLNKSASNNASMFKFYALYKGINLLTALALRNEKDAAEYNSTLYNIKNISNDYFLALKINKFAYEFYSEKQIDYLVDQVENLAKTLINDTIEHQDTNSNELLKAIHSISTDKIMHPIFEPELTYDNLDTIVDFRFELPSDDLFV